MPLDFPASPTNGQIYGAYVYDSSTTAWRSKGGAVAATYVSDTAPSGAVKGDMWYRSSDGTTYVYYVDADTSQWVEIRSEIATNKVGLVPIIPTSVTLGSGSASVDATGTITFSGATSIMANGVFTTQYNNYLQVCTFNTSVNLEARQRLTHNGSALSAAAYGWAGISVVSTGTPAYYSGSGIDWYALSGTQAATSHAYTQTIHYPMDASKITRTVFSGGFWEGNWKSVNFSGAYNSTSLASGIQMYSTTANTMSGEMLFFGYN